jgi:hypothetical protein
MNLQNQDVLSDSKSISFSRKVQETVMSWADTLSDSDSTLYNFNFV